MTSSTSTTTRRPTFAAKHATIIALNQAEHATWMAHDEAANLRHVRTTTQDLDAIARHAGELVRRLEHALQAARTLEQIAANDIEHRRALLRDYAALLKVIG